jgi:fucose permease
MFAMFAMTTDSVGVVIPAVIREFGLSMTAAGAFHYSTMTAIAVSGALLGSMADRFGRKATILAGLALFALSACLFIVGDSFGFFLVLLAASGTAIGIFKTGALALIGDISRSTTEHTSTMNTIEGFFGVGAIIGPAIVTALLARGTSWKWLYVIAAGICVVLTVVAWTVRYPTRAAGSASGLDVGGTLAMVRNRYAIAFSAGAMLYVAVESAVYVWMPTLLASYAGGAAIVAAYALSIFFVLRATGRFLGAWMLATYRWTSVMAIAGVAIFLCFAGSMALGVSAAIWLLPLSGLFMSVVYPTLNSKGISCFQKSRHGAVAGVILFFTCFGAVAGPLAMAAISDAAGSAEAGFVLATALSAVLCAGLVWNWTVDPTRTRLEQLDVSEYDPSSPAKDI